MGKALIIAEKPSVAADLAKALGKFKKEKDFYESEDLVISSAVGHLLELALPSGQKVKWSFESLPIIPEQFDLKPIERSEARYKVLKKLISRKDVDRLINACDAGREGELIFRYIIQAVGSKKPIQRLWLQSMTPTSIREGFTKLRDGSELEPLAAAAVCRSESDWLVGINGTRAFTAFNSKGGGFQLTTVGRVQTPTLSILVEREDQIRKFLPKGYWELHGTFAAATGQYPGRWFDPAFKKEKENSGHEKAERLWEEAQALAIQKECEGKPGQVSEEKKPTTQLSPLLYDLTSLQREANGRFGLSAKRTLQIAQALYEKHKAVTYPRTDSRYLPEDYVTPVKNVLQKLKGTSYGSFASTILTQGWLKPTKRVFNQAKVSDHFAIIPTPEIPERLDEYEEKVYGLIVRRFLAVFFPPALYEVTTRITRVESHSFKTEGKILKDPGWLAIYGREEIQDDDGAALLISIEDGETVRTEAVEVRGLQTKPPARFSEATLLSAMEGAGKLIDDEELRDAMAAKGLGTPATRASIIEGLIMEHYITREGRELIPSSKAFALMETLKTLGIPGLTSPEMTGEWEYKLKLIEQKKLSRSDFMHEIERFTEQIVSKAKSFQEDAVSLEPFDGVDPFSGQHMMQTLRDFRTPDGTLVIRKAIGGRMMEPMEVIELLEKRVLGPLDGFRSRFGKSFSAALKLTDEKKVEMVWDTAAIDQTVGLPDFSKEEPVGKCPVDNANIFETASAYICENSVGEKPTCKFRLGKKILEQEISREQAIKLFKEGKTDLLTKFVSKKTKRPFSAFLLLKGDKIAFDFPPREPRGKGSKTTKAKVKKFTAKAETAPEPEA